MATEQRWQAGLALRLFALGALAALLITAIGGSLLRQSVQASLLNSHQQRLEEKLERIQAGFFRPVDETAIRWVGRSNDEFGRIFSGWYWQLEYANTLLASRSLWDSTLDTARTSSVDDSTLLALPGPQAQDLIGLRQTIDIDGLSAVLHLYGPAEEITTALDQLDQTLFITQMALLAGLLISSAVQVHLGLRPLHRLRERLGLVSQGRSDKVGDGYGPELDPLARELDTVLARNARIVERARGHAADLSHALKKPLTLLHAESTVQDHPMLRQQVNHMTQLIDRHLARAGSGAGAIKAIVVSERVSGLLALMQRLHAGRQLNWQATIPPELHWRGEATDFEEMLGNLLDNAGKWATSTVCIRAGIDAGNLVVDIDDDGPGMSPAQLLACVKRGQRFDESVEGSGLGLVIARDIAETYGGEIKLSASGLGGLHVCLKLPA